MFGEGALTFREFTMNEPVPLAVVHDSVLDFLRDRDDAVLFGAQAVNAYVDISRMTQDVDITSTCAKDLATELQKHLSDQFHIAVRIREIGEGVGYRVYQLTKPKHRHLVDIRQVDVLPSSQRIDGVLVVTPIELIAGKVLAFSRRKGKPKAGTDWRDLAHLLLRFPELKSKDGPIRQRLLEREIDEQVLEIWQELVLTEFLPEEEEDEFL